MHSKSNICRLLILYLLYSPLTQAACSKVSFQFARKLLGQNIEVSQIYDKLQVHHKAFSLPGQNLQVTNSKQTLPSLQRQILEQILSKRNLKGSPGNVAPSPSSSPASPSLPSTRSPSVTTSPSPGLASKSPPISPSSPGISVNASSPPLASPQILPAPEPVVASPKSQPVEPLNLEPYEVFSTPLAPILGIPGNATYINGHSTFVYPPGYANVNVLIPGTYIPAALEGQTPVSTTSIGQPVSNILNSNSVQSPPAYVGQNSQGQPVYVSQQSQVAPKSDPLDIPYLEEVNNNLNQELQNSNDNVNQDISISRSNRLGDTVQPRRVPEPVSSATSYKVSAIIILTLAVIFIL